MYRITKQHHFSASHRLTQVPQDHPCGRLHGHNYVVELVLEGEQLQDRLDWLRDFGELKQVFEWIDDNWDHRDLNQWVRDNLHLFNQTTRGLETTAENLARFLWRRFHGRLPELVAVRVSETPKTWAEYRHG